MPSYPHIGILLVASLLLLSSSVQAVNVTTETALRACMNGLDAECVVPPDTTIYLSSDVTPNHDVVLKGYGRTSAIHLQSQTRLLTVSKSVTIMDLDISYGYTEDPQGGSFILLTQTGTVNLTRLTVRHMHSKSGIGGAITGEALSGSMTDVVMGNCTEGSGSGPGGLYLQVATFRFTDVSFIDCLSAESAERQGIAIVGLGSTPWSVTFAGKVFFLSSTGLFNQGSQAYFQTSPNINGSVLSEPTQPANWIFTSLPQSGIQINATSFFKFQANSVSTDGIRFGLRPSSYLLIASGTSVEIEVHTYIRASDIGIASLAASNTALVATELTSINSIATVVLHVLGNYTTIQAGSIQIDSFQKTALRIETSAQLNLQASSLTMTRSPSVQYPAPAVYVYGDASMFIDSLFNVSGSNVSSEPGGAIFFSGRSLSITTGLNMVFQYNYASYGGAIYVESGNLTLVANLIDFSYNSAQFGGAIAAVNANALSMSGRVRYESNQAAFGGAIYTKAVLASSFRAAEFSSNHATLEGCLIHFLDTCTPFVPTGTSTGNTAANLSGNSCKDNNPMCTDPMTPSSNSDTCSGLPPSIGSWECSNGQWTSIGSVSGDSVLIPSGSQTLIITGNLTVSGDITFTGLGSTIVVEGGCVSISGSLQIELSEEDLEQISKEAGSSRTVQLISQSANCSSLQSLAINAFKGEKSCRKVESASSREDSEGSTSSLLAVFKVSSSGCNTKWIILGSVLGGVLLLVVIIILLVTFNPRMKAFVRPFWGRAQMDAGNKIVD